MCGTIKRLRPVPSSLLIAFNSRGSDRFAAASNGCAPSDIHAPYPLGYSVSTQRVCGGGHHNPRVFEGVTAMAAALPNGPPDYPGSVSAGIRSLCGHNSRLRAI